MNKILEAFARAWLKDHLVLVPEPWQMLFKRMYAPKNLDQSIVQVVDRISVDKLDWAMVQVQNSVEKILGKNRLCMECVGEPKNGGSCQESRVEAKDCRNYSIYLPENG
jgi:hypothetical protein